MNESTAKSAKVMEGFFLTPDNDKVQPCVGEVHNEPTLRRLGYWYEGNLFMPTNLIVGLN